MARRAALATALAALTVGLATIGYAATRLSGGVEPKAWMVRSTPSPERGSPTASPPPSPPPSVPPGSPGRTWSAWALLDRRTGSIRGSADLDRTNNTESMVKAWIAADDLRRRTDAGGEPDPTELATLSTMIRDSDDKAAQSVYLRNGADAVISRLISTCGLTDTTVHHQWWSYTQMSPRDAVRMGACIADGRAAGPRWTSWLLDEMRHVRGEGRFGIVDALPAGSATGLAIKNGWTLHYAEAEWNINCLAIADDWILAVEMRFPAAVGGLGHGAETCASIARQTVVDH
jgi:hypothetical protein